MTSATEAPVSEAIFSSTPRTRDNCSGLFASQSFCGARRILAPFAPPLRSELRNVEALAHAVSTSSCIVRSLSAIFDLTDSTS